MTPLRFLVLGEDDALAGEIARALRRTGGRADVVRDGIDLLFRVDRQSPSAIVLGLELPDLSGFRLVELLRHDPATRHIPLVAATHLSFQEALPVVRTVDAIYSEPIDPAHVAGCATALATLAALAADQETPAAAIAA
jgi:CheY-like chemotaxis protein